MPELNAIHIIITAVVAVLGIGAGWAFRGKRAATEKSVANSGWQEQLNAQRSEHDRLIEQNKALMEQVSQYLAANKDVKNRATRLAEQLQKSNQMRDELHAQIKDVRASLESSLSEREQLLSNANAQAAATAEVAAKNAEIKKLQQSLESWQSRLPPLIEKYTQRNKEAEQLEVELAAAKERIAELEAADRSSETLVEPVHHPAELTDGMGASNENIKDNEEEIEGFFDDALATLQVDFKELVAREEILEADDDAVDDEAPDDDTDDAVDDEAPDDDTDDAADDEAPDGDTDADTGTGNMDVDDIDDGVTGAGPADPDGDDVADSGYLHRDEDEEADASTEDDAEADSDTDEDAGEPLETDDSDQDEDETPGDTRDNLRRIKGIGPAIEKTLNELGIFRFQQIAEMSEYEIDRIANRLKGFRSRIYREDWIGQARELRDQKYAD